MSPMQWPRGTYTTPYSRPTRELDYAGAPLSLPYEGLGLRLGRESTHEATFPADAWAAVSHTTEDTVHSIHHDGASQRHTVQERSR